jgi:hypothetical protein
VASVEASRVKVLCRLARPPPSIEPNSKEIPNTVPVTIQKAIKHISTDRKMFKFIFKPPYLKSEYIILEYFETEHDKRVSKKFRVVIEKNNKNLQKDEENMQKILKKELFSL